MTFDGGDDHVRSTLVGAHRDRHSAGRQRTKDKKETVAKLREQGQSAHADRLEEVHTRRTHAAIQRARHQYEIQAKRRWGPIRAKVSELPKVSGKLRRARYNREDFGTGGIREPVCFGARDLYVEFIPRGLKSGSSRNYKDGKPKPAGNRSPWKSGETGDKIQYICREEALEDVPGAVISNMGNNLQERVACGIAIERLEELGRADAGVYRHVIVALPHELAPEDRVELLNRLVKPLGDLKLPFTASLHKPDKDGDERNYHAHIVLSLRPLERKGPKEWEFAPSKLTWIETPAAHLLIRRHVAREFNRALKKAAVETRWTHLSRAARSEPSPGNTKRHRSDIRGDRALDAAVKDEHAAKRHLRLVAAVQSCVEALRSEAVRLAGAAVSRSAFLGRVVALIEGSDADQTATNRRQRDERGGTLEKKVAAEVAAEALRARHRGQGDLDPDAPVRSPSLAPLVEHFREGRQIQTALAHKLGVKSNPARSQTLDRQPPSSANTVSPRPDMVSQVGRVTEAATGATSDELRSAASPSGNNATSSVERQPSRPGAVSDEIKPRPRSNTEGDQVAETSLSSGTASERRGLSGEGVVHGDVDAAAKARAKQRVTKRMARAKARRAELEREQELRRRRLRKKAKAAASRRRSAQAQKAEEEQLEDFSQRARRAAQSPELPSNPQATKDRAQDSDGAEAERQIRELQDLQALLAMGRGR